MKRAVEISARATRDARRIGVWIAKRSPQGARAWFDAFDAALEALAENAEAFSRAPEDIDHDETIRNIFFSTRRGRTYRVIYIFRGDRVFVTHIRGSGQRPVRRDRFYPK